MSDLRRTGTFQQAPSRRRRRITRPIYAASTVHQAVLTLTSLSEQVATVVEDVERFLSADLRQLLDIDITMSDSDEVIGDQSDSTEESARPALTIVAEPVEASQNSAAPSTAPKGPLRHVATNHLGYGLRSLPAASAKNGAIPSQLGRRG